MVHRLEPLHLDGMANFLEGVACVRASNCTAVGHAYYGTVDQTLIETWNGTAWSIAPSGNTSALVVNRLHGVSCVSAGNCSTVGGYATAAISRTFQTLIENQVTLASTSLTTALSGASEAGAAISVPANSAVTDQATLTGTNASSAGGSVTYSVYSDAACSATVAAGSPASSAAPPR